jgi:uncharacterized repeat protein (TIGR03943 family)
VSRRTQGTLLAIMGLVALRLVITGTYDSYVRAGMRWPLLAASVFLVVVGGGSAMVDAWQADRRATRSSPHDHAPLVGWVLILPLAALLLVAPAPLGADAASRQAPYTPAYQGSAFDPLPPPTGGAVDLRLGEFIERALWDTNHSVDDTDIRLTGFVVRDVSVADGFVLTRFHLSCCAADAIPIEVGITGAPEVPPDDQWVAVTGQLAAHPVSDPTDTTPARVDLSADQVVLVDEPENPYE